MIFHFSEIEFTMPLKGANKRHSGTDSGVDSNFSSSTSQDTESDLVNQDDDGDDDEDEEKWLESIGIDQKQIKLITNNKVCMQKHKHFTLQSIVRLLKYCSHFYRNC